jgi:uridine kinase
MEIIIKGRSGSGKTTMSLAIQKLIESHGGTVINTDDDLNSYPPDFYESSLNRICKKEDTIIITKITPRIRQEDAK